MESTVIYTAKIIEELTTNTIAVVLPPFTCPAEIAMPVSVKMSGTTMVADGRFFSKTHAMSNTRTG